MSCPGGLNIKGEHFPCDMEIWPHDGLACTSKRAEAIWMQSQREIDQDQTLMSTLDVNIRWGIDRETGKPVVAYDYRDPADPDADPDLPEVIKALEFTKLSVWDDVRRDNPHHED